MDLVYKIIEYNLKLLDADYRKCCMIDSKFINIKVLSERYFLKLLRSDVIVSKELIPNIDNDSQLGMLLGYIHYDNYFMYFKHSITYLVGGLPIYGEKLKDLSPETCEKIMDNIVRLYKILKKKDRYKNTEYL